MYCKSTNSTIDLNSSCNAIIVILRRCLKNQVFLCPLCLWLSLITPISFTAAARYGKGVYFALNASYSMQEKYSSAEKDGSKCILVCSLLVCKMTKGNEKMKVPPPIPDNPQVSPPAIK